MDLRQQKILEAIIEKFIQSATPVGSMHIYDSYDFDISPATIRNEMALLEREGYVCQPHTSAGRIPTGRAYRMFVNQMKIGPSIMARARKDIERIQKQHYLKKVKEKLYDIVAILAGVTSNISFATLPDAKRVFYIGVSNILGQPEFISDPLGATKVIKILENELFDILSELEITSEGAIYIGEENILPEFESCSLLAVPYEYKGFDGVMGILGCTRMDYAYNMAALKSAVEIL